MRAFQYLDGLLVRNGDAFALDVANGNHYATVGNGQPCHRPQFVHRCHAVLRQLGRLE